VKRGFTIIELLVASLLLGLLLTILTMIFNQSSIAWRTGLEGVTDLNEVRAKAAAVRDQADSVYVWNDKLYVLQSLWDKNGSLRARTIGEMNASAKFLRDENVKMGADHSPSVNIGSDSSGGSSGATSFNTYSVNVESAGPDRNYKETWDNIWSNPVDALLNK